MKQLIRFEDDYGVSDIVCMAHDLGLGNLADNRLTRITKDENVLVQSGLSIGAV